MNRKEVFKKICREIDYQQEYTYEQRVDLFNKYHISTSVKYVNLIMLLSRWLQNQGNFIPSTSYEGVSHSGHVLTAFNKQVKEDKSNFVKFESVPIADRYSIFNYNSNTHTFDKKMLFVIADKYTKIRFYDFNFFAKKGVCFFALANEFLKDWGYEEIF